MILFIVCTIADAKTLHDSMVTDSDLLETELLAEVTSAVNK